MYTHVALWARRNFEPMKSLFELPSFLIYFFHICKYLFTFYNSQVCHIFNQILKISGVHLNPWTFHYQTKIMKIKKGMIFSKLHFKVRFMTEIWDGNKTQIDFKKSHMHPTKSSQIKNTGRWRQSLWNSPRARQVSVIKLVNISRSEFGVSFFSFLKAI